MRRLIIFAIALCAPGIAGAQADNNGQIDPLTDGVLILRNSEGKPCASRKGGPDHTGASDASAGKGAGRDADRQAGRIDMKADEQAQAGPAAGGELKLGKPPAKANACR